MDSCRIRWGRVLERDGDQLVVNVVPLAMVDGRLELGPARAERIQAWHDGAAFVDGVAVRRRDLDPLVVGVRPARRPRARPSLIAWTERELRVANLTI